MGQGIMGAADGGTLPPWSVDEVLPKRLAMIAERLGAIAAETAAVAADGDAQAGRRTALEQEAAELAESRWAIGKLGEVEAARAKYVAAMTAYPDRDRTLEALDREHGLLVHAITMRDPEDGGNAGTALGEEAEIPF